MKIKTKTKKKTFPKKKKIKTSKLKKTKPARSKKNTKLVKTKTKKKTLSKKNRLSSTKKLQKKFLPIIEKIKLSIFGLFGLKDFVAKKVNEIEDYLEKRKGSKRSCL